MDLACMSDKDQILKWTTTWQKASDALNAVKVETLRDKNYYNKNKAVLNDMLQYAFDHRVERKDSGLVEMQSYFMKIHQQILDKTE